MHNNATTRVLVLKSILNAATIFSFPTWHLTFDIFSAPRDLLQRDMSLAKYSIKFIYMSHPWHHYVKLWYIPLSLFWHLSQYDSFSILALLAVPGVALLISTEWTMKPITWRHWRWPSVTSLLPAAKTERKAVQLQISAFRTSPKLRQLHFLLGKRKKTFKNGKFQNWFHSGTPSSARDFSTQMGRYLRALFHYSLEINFFGFIRF